MWPAIKKILNSKESIDNEVLEGTKLKNYIKSVKKRNANLYDSNKKVGRQIEYFDNKNIITTIKFTVKNGPHPLGSQTIKTKDLDKFVKVYEDAGYTIIKKD